MIFSVAGFPMGATGVVTKFDDVVARVEGPTVEVGNPI